MKLVIVLTIVSITLAVETQLKCDGIRAKKHAILTTASCVKGLQLSDIRLNAMGGGIIEKVIVHPKYRNNSKSHDIALIKMAKPLHTENKRIKAKIAKKMPKTNTSVYVKDCEGKAVPVKILSKNTCKKQRGTFNTGKLICTTYTKINGKTPCYPARGSPLMSERLLVGIFNNVTDGKAPLKKGSKVLLYTNAVSHRQWVKKILKQIKKEGKKKPCDKKTHASMRRSDQKPSNSSMHNDSTRKRSHLMAKPLILEGIMPNETTQNPLENITQVIATTELSPTEASLQEASTTPLPTKETSKESEERKPDKEEGKESSEEDPDDSDEDESDEDDQSDENQDDQSDENQDDSDEDDSDESHGIKSTRRSLTPQEKDPKPIHIPLSETGEKKDGVVFVHLPADLKKYGIWIVLSKN